MKSASSEHGKRAIAKQKIAHEMSEYLTVFLLVAPFVLSFTAYRMYLEGELGERYLAFGMALGL